MTDLELDVITWFTERQLSYKPKHFVVAKTPTTTENKNWIFEKLRGRFCFVQVEESSRNDPFDLLASLDTYPAFEDPAEATFYELTWS